MNGPDEMPYCVWYPGLATEDTYRDLACRYPSLRYQVGRACAVGGYLALYLELDLLPDVSVAEEAREAGNDGSTAIFEHIMNQPIRYAVMNDYDRTVNLSNPRAGACLNGDTAISPPPDKRDGDGDDHWIWPKYFDITEQWTTSNRPSNPLRREDPSLPRAFTHLLHSPLPADLPIVRKDALIVMAAYEGNIDRYHRLRRPTMVPEEPEALIHGIYHSTSFAQYCNTHSLSAHPAWECVSLAMTARFIMINDLSRISEDLEETASHRLDFPLVIWYPLFPREETLRELIRRRPKNVYIREVVALACIAADYRGTYDALAPVLEPTMRLWQQALKSANSHYREDLKQRVASGAWPNVDPDDFPDWYCDWYPQLAKDMEPTTTTLLPMNWPCGVVEPHELASERYYNWYACPVILCCFLLSLPGLNMSLTARACREREANAAPWELYICASDILRDELEKNPEDPAIQLYGEWKYDRSAWEETLPWMKEGPKKSGERREGTETAEKQEEER